MADSDAQPNYLAKMMNREFSVYKELDQIHDEKSPETIQTPNGTLDHSEWLTAELEELQTLKQKALPVISTDGTVDYTAENTP